MIAAKKLSIKYSSLNINKIMGLIPNPTYWKDTQGIYLDCNQAYEKFIGLKKSSIIGKSADDLFSKSYVDRIKIAESSVLKNMCEITTDEINPANKQTFHQIKMAPMEDQQGKIAGLLGIVLEKNKPAPLSETKLNLNKIIEENEETKFRLNYLDTIVACMPGNVFWKDRQGFYMGCNDNAAKLVKLKSRHDIVGKKLHEFVDKTYADYIERIDDEIMAKGHPSTSEESAFDIHGNPAVYLATKIPLHDGKGNVTGLVGISVDITERKRLEAELREAKEKAEIANHLKTEFIHNMEHDIRTPFNGIYAMAKILESEETDAFKKEYLSDISSCAKELLDYCNTILEFSQIESNNLPIISQKFNIRHIIDKVIIMEKPAAKLKKIDLLTDCPDNITDIFVSDEHRIYRILINLVSNAIKFTQEGYVKISFELIKQQRRLAIIRLIVEDTGIGIPLDKRQYIYEKFTKLSPSNRGLYKGMGLGLRIVKQFIEELDGEIEINSNTPHGTRFICTLPLKRPLIATINEGE